MSKKITIPKNWTGQQAYAVIDFINLIDTAIWDVYDDSIIEEIQRQQEIDDQLEAQISAAADDSDDLLDDDIPW